MGKVRIPGLAADFRVPRGWPVPTDSWLRSNAFWDPPEGWVPLPGLPRAPAGWRFWQPNDQWQRGNPALYRPTLIWLRASSVLGWLFLATLASSALLRLGGTDVVLWPVGVALLAAGSMCFVAGEVIRGRITRSAMVQIAVLAAAERERRLVREYQRYLRET